MEYKILTSNNPDALTSAVNSHIEKGWEPVGSHQVVVDHIQNRFSGMQHKDSIYTHAYTQTMVKK